MYPYIFNLNALSIRFGVSKITPTKVGRFVTLWERSEYGSIQPYDISDSANLCFLKQFYVNRILKAHYYSLMLMRIVMCFL
ncbi:MepB family protein [Bacillus bingmayongensis]|uniref:MepB family protein n=1 Tax=Bacillus bingmayongensis TaxID=1150157 RepID=UPI0009D9E1BF